MMYSIMSHRCNQVVCYWIGVFVYSEKYIIIKIREYLKIFRRIILKNVRFKW